MLTVISAALLLFGLGGMVGTTVWILRRGNDNPMTRLFIVCQLSIALWLISQLLILFSVNNTQLTISYLIGNVGICAFSPFWLMFSAEYSDAEPSIKRLTRLLPAVSAAMFAIIASNPLHKLYYAEFGKGAIRYGFVFYVFQILFYIFIISGICLMFIHHSRRSRADARSNQSILLALAAAVPLMINIFTVSGIIKSKIELTPLFFAFSDVMVLIAIRRFGLLNINRIAINATINNLSEAVIVFDPDGNMTYKNKYAEEHFPVAELPNISEFFRRISELSGITAEPSAESVELTVGDEKYRLKSSLSLNGSGAELARIITITNVSEYYDLVEAEKKLSLEHERNRIAQEIHDSAGHTFTLISSIAKIMDSEVRSGTAGEKLLEYTTEIDGLSRSGVTQLRCSINNLRDDEFMTTVERAVRTVTSAIRNIDIDLCFQGKEDDSFAFCIRQVYDTTRETVTNAMRYSGADRIDIIVKFLDDRLELYIFDNGKGCSEIKENNGLSGIRRRIADLGGTVRFSSVEGEGFTTIVKIPKGGK